MGAINTYDFNGEYVTWTTDGENAGTVFYRSGRFNCTNVCGTLTSINGYVDHEFLSYHLGRVAKSYVSYIGNPKLMNGVMANVGLILPPLPQQKKIAKILTTVDNLIEQTQALIEKYTAIKQGMMADLFTRGLDITGTPATNSNYGQLRPSVEDAPELYKDTELGWVPMEWEQLNLSDICLRITDGSHQSIALHEDGDIPFLFVSCIKRGKIVWEKCGRIRVEEYQIISRGREPKKGDILYTAVGSYGNAALVEADDCFSFQRHIAYIKPDQRKIYSEYLAALLDSDSIKHWADGIALGNAQKTVTLGALSNYPIPLPSIREQTHIYCRIKEISKCIDKEISFQAKYQKIKKGLMQDLLTGKVPVNA